jgi:alkanesulfonate monooxygenase SsuD/methylene tetrahydromethanopterin reductase-like flavin-dependent oxidoreductase (luciferase family)
VSFDGEFDRIEGAGLAPLPVQRPIPIWIGGSSPAAYRRMGRLADGWFPQVPPGERLDDALAIIADAASAAGRDPGSIGMEGTVRWIADDRDKFARQVAAWRAAGATHLTVNTMNAGCNGLDGHLAAIEAAVALCGPLS